MWSTLFTIIARFKVKNDLKKEEKKHRISSNSKLSANNKDNQKIKKLKRKVSRINIALGVSILIPVISIILVFAIVSYSVMTLGSLTGFNLISIEEEDVEDEEDKYDWTWETDTSTELEDVTSGGVYPKDPQLKQIAKFLEVLQKSCDIVNGENGEKTALPSSVISITIRETGGKLSNTLVADPSIDIYGQLVYDIPVCGKGTSCTWVKNGVSHFVGGSVAGGVDKGDPATMPPNTSSSYYNAYRTNDGHALGYCQMEVIYIDSYLTRVYPIGDYKDKKYDNSTDRYNMDNTLKFIRPNIGYIPDLILSTTAQLGGGLWRDANTVYNQMKSESWFNELSEDEKTYARSCLRQMNYVGGSVDVTNMTVMKQLIKVTYALKKDGYITDIRDFAEWGFTHYTGVSNMLSTIYKGNKISRPSTTPFTTLINKVIQDKSLGSNTISAVKELQSALLSASGGSESTFLKYGTGGKYLWRHAIPGALGFESISHYIYKIMVSDIEKAEKEQSSSESLGVGIEGTNYIDYIGSGIFLNPTNSDYYCPDLQSVWYAQGKRGGTSIFGTTLPSYTTTIQNKRYMDRNYYNYGCPAYSMAMLLSNMTGFSIMPDALPGTSTAGPEWIKGSHSVASSGLGFTSGLYVINSLNKSLQDKGVGYQLKYKQLTKSQLSSLESNIYDWFDHGAMLWVRVVSYNSSYPSTGDHFVTLSGYDKNSKVGNNYDIRVLNSVTGTKVYTLINGNQGQLITAEKLNENGLAYHLRNYSTYCAIVIWRDDISESLAGL